VHRPSLLFELTALAGIPLPVELELAHPELGVGSGETRLTTRAVVPVAAMDEDRNVSTGICDIRSAGSTLPVQAVARMAGFPERATDDPFRSRVAGPIGPHDGTHRRGGWLWIGELKTCHADRV